MDVPKKGVQWGKYLRVRVRVIATKKLIRGKKVTIEGGEANTNGYLIFATSVGDWIMA